MSTIEKKEMDDETERERSNFTPLYDYEDVKQKRTSPKFNRNLDPTTHSVDNCDISPSK